jgi:DNA-binding NarL/FixJ family response regulator
MKSFQQIANNPAQAIKDEIAALNGRIEELTAQLANIGQNEVCARPDPVLTGKQMNHQNRHAVENTMSGQRSSNEVSHPLSTREIAILQCIMHGDSNKLIARHFEIAESTVKAHVKAILRKIRVGNRTQAAIWAIGHLSSKRSNEDDLFTHRRSFG